MSQSQPIAAALDHHERDDERRALVSINKSVVLDQSMQQCAGFSMNCAMIARIWPANRGLDTVEADNACPSTVGQGLVMCSKHISEFDTIMPHRSARRFKASRYSCEISLITCSEPGLARVEICVNAEAATVLTAEPEPLGSLRTRDAGPAVRFEVVEDFAIIVLPH